MAAPKFLIPVADDPSPSHLYFGRIQKGLRSSGGCAAACRNLQHVCVCQAVLICMVLLAKHASPNGQKTKKRDRMATHTVQPGCRAHFTPPSPWKPSISWAWRVRTSPMSEERVRLRPGSRVGRQKETFPFCHDKKTPTAVIQQLTALSHTEAVWKSN